MKASATAEAHSSGTHTIGDLAAQFGLETHVLRHWEKEGLLHPARDASGYRRYGHLDAVRVATIIHQRSLGIALPVIRTLLEGEAQDRHAALTAHREAIDAQIAALQVARDMTEHALACHAHDVAACGTFQSYVQDILTGVPAPRPLDDRLTDRPRE